MLISPVFSPPLTHSLTLSLSHTNLTYSQHTLKNSGDTEHTIHIAIKQANLDVLEEKLYDVSTPTSSNYGKHWTHEQVG